MKLGWWWVPVVVVVGFGGYELVGDYVLGVREYHAAAPAPGPPPPIDDQAREAFAREPGQPGPDPLEPELADVLATIGRAAREGHAAEVADAFDADRLYDEITRTELFARSGLRPNPFEGPGVVRAGLWTAVHDGGPGLAWDRAVVRKIVPLGPPGEYLAYARQYRGSRSIPYRWWMVRGRDGWKVYDAEDVRVGLRLSRQAAGLFARSSGGSDVPAELLAALAALRRASEALAEGHTNDAEAALLQVRTVSLPAEQYVLRCVLEGAVAALKGNAADALAWADRADAASPGLPAVDYLRASAHAVKADWPNAALFARKYLDAVGPDVGACRILGTALRELGDRPGAIDAFELGLKDDPTRDDLKAAVLALRSGS